MALCEACGKELKAECEWLCEVTARQRDSASGENIKLQRARERERERDAWVKGRLALGINEVACEDESNSRRFVDILAFNPHGNRALNVDPTIRFETNDDQDTLVQEEKSVIYVPCIADLQRRYEHLGGRQFEVIGLWMGARGTVGLGILNFFERFGLPKNRLPELAERCLAVDTFYLHSQITRHMF